MKNEYELMTLQKREAKVKEIKEQIKNGEFKINYDLIARKLQSGEFKDLFKKD